MKFGTKFLGVVVGLAIIVLLFYIFFANTVTISANGISTIEAEPSNVVIYLSVMTKNDSAAEAQKSNEEITDALISNLKGIGFSDDELQLSQYNIYEDYDWTNPNNPKRKQVVNRQVILKTEKFELTTAIVDAAIDAGAIVSSMSFELTQAQENMYKAQALEEATKDAGVKAEAIANGVGKKVGRVVSIKTSDFYYQPYVYYEKAAATGELDSFVAAEEARSAAASISPQKIEVNAQVTVEYALRRF